MSSPPQVSVIIPNRERDGPLRRAVDSVLEQSGVSFELIVVDDASVEPPLGIYQDIVQAGHQVLYQPRCQGPGAARNLGARRACGKYLAMLDSDDHWLPGKLARQLESLRESGLRVGQVEEIWFRDGARVLPPKPYRIDGGDLFERTLRTLCVSSSSIVVERSLFWEHGGFDEELFVCEDYDLWAKVACHQLFDVCQTPLAVKFGGHADQLSKALPAMDRFRMRALAKGLLTGAYGERYRLAAAELAWKAAILEKGSAKRGFLEALELCERLQRDVAIEDWPSAAEHSLALLALWPLKP